MENEVNLLAKSRTEVYYCHNTFKITKEEWISLLNDEETIKEKDFQLFKVMYNNYDCDVPGKQLSQKLNMRLPPLNRQVGRLGEKIATKFDIPEDSLVLGRKKKYWLVPFCGKRTKAGFCWKLRPELQEAMGEILERRFEKK